jgi:hypothetical protein
MRKPPQRSQWLHQLTLQPKVAKGNPRIKTVLGKATPRTNPQPAPIIPNSAMVEKETGIAPRKSLACTHPQSSKCTDKGAKDAIARCRGTMPPSSKLGGTTAKKCAKHNAT